MIGVVKYTQQNRLESKLQLHLGDSGSVQEHPEKISPNIGTNIGNSSLVQKLLEQQVQFSPKSIKFCETSYGPSYKFFEVSCDESVDSQAVPVERDERKPEQNPPINQIKTNASPTYQNLTSIKEKSPKHHPLNDLKLNNTTQLGLINSSEQYSSSLCSDRSLQ